MKFSTLPRADPSHLCRASDIGTYPSLSNPPVNNPKFWDFYLINKELKRFPLNIAICKRPKNVLKTFLDLKKSAHQIEFPTQVDFSYAQNCEPLKLIVRNSEIIGRNKRN